MSKVVLDSSAVLAALQKEPGGDQVLSRLDGAAISAVNFAEVVSKLARTGGDLSQVLADLQDLVSEICPFDTDQAVAVGQLAATTRDLGLSLGDRACLSLAKALGVPVLTADQAWAKLDIGVSVELIRGNSS
ncbi:MAG TPA: type II toxin-antitoxin system VapC family toxin [Urbifossiella sp.]|nr:type II toxin-antitoxin system VapC family toxin [Urbifossiella sp.]